MDFEVGVYKISQTGDTVSQVSIFDPACWTIAPLTFSLVDLPPPSLCQSRVQYQYTNSVWLGGGGVLICVEDHILQEINTQYLTRFRTYKISRPPQTNT